MKPVLRRVALAGCLAAIAVVVAALALEREMQRLMQHTINLDAPVLLRVAPGSNVRTLGRQLEREGWLADYRLFALHARLAGDASRIQAGTYEVLPGDTPQAVLARIVAGRTKRFDITFVEGATFADLRRVLAAAPHLQTTLAGVADDDVMAALDLPPGPPEGLFFPSTYHYADGSTDRDVLRRAWRKMQQVLDAAWELRAPELPYTDAYAALIMASIVEKETGSAGERAEIAGVFVRRLRRGMKLQTDPTVIYGLGAAFDGNLTRADLARDTPYNTYTRGGLPPTPIAMPGRAAIEAALHPADGETLYFVARGDGSHQFSKTLREHNQAVRRYQLRR